MTLLRNRQAIAFAGAITFNYRIWQNMVLALAIKADYIPLGALRLKGIWEAVLPT
ncbi:MAG: hypothetical protein ACFB12_28555 [Leptolyngbyaceae cyanobacterium]